mmetsp:Transcript_27141/g.56313  ORF Transcript_27141/g.56313 Transcript_27141/m.56313 type:complete len:458 (+) Transcript_27141:70-1443(+)
MPPARNCTPCPLSSADLGCVAGYAKVPLSPTDAPDEPWPPGVDNAHVAAGKAISFLMKIENIGYCEVEKTSVYGAAIAIPQIARSVGWSATMTGLAIRAYIFLLFNYLIQGFLISVMNEEAHIMNPFKGEMHLCDFGASISNCPSSANCRGPGGTNYTFPRLYGFSTWSTRIFVRDALKALFPERSSDIETAADPGEYGLEDYYCRLVCCLIFMMEVVGDLQRSIGLATLLNKLPSREDTWIRYEVPDWGEKEHAKRIHGWTELDLVKFQVAGMPRFWKVVNALVILFPKIYIWSMLVVTGFHFLMETAGIMELVINCMALSFVLGVDEMVFERLATLAAKHMMEKLEDYALFNTREEEQETDAEVMERFQKEEMQRPFLKMLSLVLPRRLLVILIMMVFFVLKYYYSNCRHLDDGSWVSQDIFMPERVSYNPLSFIYSFLLDQSTVPIWSMPSDGG